MKRKNTFAYRVPWDSQQAATSAPSSITTVQHLSWPYGVVTKGLLTFLESLYKEVAKTTSGTLVYRFERQTARKSKKILPSKNTVSST